jgi:hypothetical protein
MKKNRFHPTSFSRFFAWSLVLFAGAFCVPNWAVSAVTDLEKSQAANENVLYQYTFEGGRYEGLKQKAGSQTPDMDKFLTTGNHADEAISFEAGYDQSSTALQTKPGWLSGATRKTGAALKSKKPIIFPVRGTIEYLVKADAINDSGFAVSGNVSDPKTRWYFFFNGDKETDKAIMMLGGVNAVDLIGGAAGISYKPETWYYVAQTWEASEGVVVMSAWVADLSLETPELKRTVMNQGAPHAGGMEALLRLGSLADTGNFFRGKLDALAIYSTQLSEFMIQEHLNAIKIK